MSDFSVLNMEPQHIDDVVEIEKLSFKTPWSHEAFTYELNSNKCARYRVIINGERVVAYGGMWIMIDEAHITNIAVHPDFRGMGIGDRLLGDMVEYAKSEGATSMTLEVRKSNAPAIGLYDKYGFCEVAVRKGYYQDTGEDAIIMWKHDL